MERISLGHQGGELRVQDLLKPNRLIAQLQYERAHYRRDHIVDIHLHAYGLVILGVAQHIEDQVGQALLFSRNGLHTGVHRIVALSLEHALDTAHAQMQAGDDVLGVVGQAGDDLAHRGQPLLLDVLILDA